MDSKYIQNEVRRLGMQETQELRDMKLKFQEILAGLKPTTNNSIEERARLENLKKGVQISEIKMANVILEEYLAQTNEICKIIDAVYAMGKNIEERMGTKKKDNRRNNKASRNRRIRKIEKELKDTRIMVAQIANETYRRKMRRKATRKEKKNTKTVKNKS